MITPRKPWVSLGSHFSQGPSRWKRIRSLNEEWLYWIASSSEAALQSFHPLCISLLFIFLCFLFTELHFFCLFCGPRLHVQRPSACFGTAGVHRALWEPCQPCWCATWRGWSIHWSCSVCRRVCLTPACSRTMTLTSLSHPSKMTLLPHSST